MEDRWTTPVGLPAPRVPVIRSLTGQAPGVADEHPAPPGSRSGAATSGDAGAPPPLSLSSARRTAPPAGRRRPGARPPRVERSMSAHSGRAAPTERRCNIDPSAPVDGVLPCPSTLPAATRGRIRIDEDLQSQDMGLHVRLREWGLDPGRFAGRERLLVVVHVATTGPRTRNDRIVGVVALKLAGSTDASRRRRGGRRHRPRRARYRARPASALARLSAGPRLAPPGRVGKGG